MRKKQDIMWEQSTLWESVEKWVIRYLKNNHPEYREMQTQAIKLVEDNPALWKLMNELRGVTLAQEDHEVHKYFETKDGMAILEYEYYFLAGQMMTFSYGAMLAQLKKEILEEQTLASEQDIGRVAQSDYFINTREEMDAPVTEFDDQLWNSMVEHLVVHSKEDIRVVYRDGIEK